MLRAAALIACCALTLSAGVDVTLAKSVDRNPGDVAATRAYLLDRRAYENATKGQRPADEASVRALVASVVGQCPNVLAGAPRNRALSEFGQEILAQVTHALAEPERSTTIAFARQVERLKWSNTKLTYFVHGEAAESRANAEIVPPELCSDARAFAASGFQTVSASTTLFLRHFNEANGKVVIVSPENPSGELDEKIRILLQPSERPDEKALIPRPVTKAEREQAIGIVVREIFSPESEISRALGLPEAKTQTPPPGSPQQL
jgi:hypothetical protein